MCVQFQIIANIITRNRQESLIMMACKFEIYRGTNDVLFYKWLQTWSKAKILVPVHARFCSISSPISESNEIIRGQYTVLILNSNAQLCETMSKQRVPINTCYLSMGSRFITSLEAFCLSKPFKITHFMVIKLLFVIA